MKKFGVGIIGLGYSGLEHLKAYLMNPKTKVIGICDTNKELIESISKKYQVKLFDMSYEELLNQKDIDIISVCTPDHLHTHFAINALKSGKHVFCEKPMATKLQDCKDIIKTVRKTKLKFLTGQILRFAPFFISLKKIYDDGELGEASFTEADYLHDCRFLLSGWRSDPKINWDTILGGGCHPIDLLRWVVDDIEEVHAYTNKMDSNAAYLYDTIVLSIRFKNGCIGKVLIIIGCPRPYALNFSIYGSKGTLINNKLFLDKILGLTDFITVPLRVVSEFPYYGNEIDHLIDCIEKDEKPMVDEIEGGKTVATCLAGIESAKTGKPVKVMDAF